jgi:hypothetical protein
MQRPGVHRPCRHEGGAVSELRPDWRTVTRRHPLLRPDALAAATGVCPHGVEASENEPIVLHGSVVVQEPDGRRHVDLSGAAWCPQTCGGAS